FYIIPQGFPGNAFYHIPKHIGTDLVVPLASRIKAQGVFCQRKHFFFQELSFVIAPKGALPAGRGCRYVTAKSRRYCWFIPAFGTTYIADQPSIETRRVGH